MTENDKELRRILDAYIKLSSDNIQQAMKEYLEKCKEIMLNIEKQIK